MSDFKDTARNAFVIAVLGFALFMACGPGIGRAAMHGLCHVGFDCSDLTDR